jgi:hypothetical protein
VPHAELPRLEHHFAVRLAPPRRFLDAVADDVRHGHDALDRLGAGFPVEADGHHLGVGETFHQRAGVRFEPVELHCVTLSVMDTYDRDGDLAVTAYHAVCLILVMAVVWLLFG